jgi:hypothetical protein
LLDILLDILLFVLLKGSALRARWNIAIAAVHRYHDRGRRPQLFHLLVAHRLRTVRDRTGLQKTACAASVKLGTALTLVWTKRRARGGRNVSGHVWVAYGLLTPWSEIGIHARDIIATSTLPARRAIVDWLTVDAEGINSMSHATRTNIWSQRARRTRNRIIQLAFIRATSAWPLSVSTSWRWRHTWRTQLPKRQSCKEKNQAKHLKEKKSKTENAFPCNKTFQEVLTGRGRTNNDEQKKETNPIKNLCSAKKEKKRGTSQTIGYENSKHPNQWKNI